MESSRSVSLENSSSTVNYAECCAGPSTIVNPPPNCPNLGPSSYIDSIKIQKDFLDQNSNSTEDEILRNVNFDEEGNLAEKWGIWSPKTKKYWTLQYMDVNHVLEKVADDREDELIEGQGSAEGDVVILVDENGRNQEIPKKFDREYSGGGTSKPPKPPAPPTHMRRVTFWVCATPTQPVDPEYDDPLVRARFTAKVLLFKTTQLLIVFCAILTMNCFPRFVEFHRISVFPIWTASVLYVMLLLSVKANLIGLTRKGAGTCLFVQTLCHIEISFTITSASDLYVIASVLMVLILTYIVIAAFCAFASLDVLNSNNLLGLCWMLVFVASIAIVGGLRHWSSKVSERATVAIIGNYWIPTLLCAETVVLLTLSELYQILQGNRIPLLNSDFDWIQATAQLY